MPNNYIRFLKSLKLFSEADLELISSRIKAKRLRKRQYLLQEGDICHEVSWVARGTMRMYLVDDFGREHIVDLMVQGRLVADRQSLAKQTPSNFNIDALEDCELLQLTMDDLTEIIKIIPNYLVASQYLINLELANQQSRNVMLLTLSAEEKYKTLMRLQPELVARVPQHMIASYLGITPATLSRVRQLLDRREAAKQ